MKRHLTILLLAVMLIGCSPKPPLEIGAATPTTENGATQQTGDMSPTSAQIEAVKQELAAQAEGQWTDYSAEWSAESAKFFLTATANADADETAIRGYCRVLDDIVARNLPGIAVSAAVYVQSGAKIECK